LSRSAEEIREEIEEGEREMKWNRIFTVVAILELFLLFLWLTRIELRPL
jgi:hypothetical protein